MRKLTKQELKLLEEKFKIYENNKDYELEAWTDSGVDMFIVLDRKDGNSFLNQFRGYVKDFDIDNEIDLHRQSEDYRNNFTIKESLEDFEDFVKTLKEITDKWEQLKKEV